MSIRVEAKVVEETKPQAVYIWGNVRLATAEPFSINGDVEGVGRFLVLRWRDSETGEAQRGNDVLSQRIRPRNEYSTHL